MGAINNDRVHIYVHFQQLQVLRPIPSSFPPSPKHGNRKAGHWIYIPHEDDLVVGLKPWNTDFITIAVTSVRNILLNVTYVGKTGVV